MPNTNTATSWTHSLNKPRESWIFPSLVALYITIIFNVHIYHLVRAFHNIESTTDILFFLSIYFVIFYIVHLLTAILSIGKGMKLWLILLLMVSGITSYARDQYTVVFDEVMVQNVIETDRGEAGELLSLRWILHVILLAVIPSLLISITPVKPQPASRDIMHRLTGIAVLSVLLVFAIAPFKKDYASLSTRQININEHVAPAAFLYAALQYVIHNYYLAPEGFQPIGTDARIGLSLQEAKKTVFVIVAGESARSANFSLAGYGRPTNPLLKSRSDLGQNILFYPNFYACGTSTVVSIPCMFSPSGSRNFDAAREKHRENLLDVLAHAGMETLWIDNNSGCKGVCTHTRYIDLHQNTHGTSCDSDSCPDIMLARVLEEQIKASTGNIVVVLHQKGSHGPAYYKRVPDKHTKFKPVCHNIRLQECKEAEIVNGYDNTILYTDYVLDSIITVLEKAAGDRDTAMLYISDHGESLGKNRLYLHGIPNGMAPDEQVHVPAIIWLSPGFLQRLDIDKECMARNSSNKYSHDYIFHTVLGLLGIETDVYAARHDLLHPCRKQHG